MIQIHNGDTYEHIKTIADKSVNLIITDPPYLMQTAGGARKIGKMSESKNDIYYKLHEAREKLAVGFDIEFMFREFRRIQPFLNLYIFANKNLLGKILGFCEAQGITNYDILVYHKINPAPAYRFHYLNDLEYIFYLCDEKGKALFNDFSTSSKLYQGNINYTRLQAIRARSH